MENQQLKQFLTNQIDIQRHIKTFIPKIWIYQKYIDMFIELDKSVKTGKEIKNDFENIFSLITKELGEYYIIRMFFDHTILPLEFCRLKLFKKVNCKHDEPYRTLLIHFILDFIEHKCRYYIICNFTPQNEISEYSKNKVKEKIREIISAVNEIFCISI